MYKRQVCVCVCVSVCLCLCECGEGQRIVRAGKVDDILQDPTEENVFLYFLISLFYMNSQSGLCQPSKVLPDPESRAKSTLIQTQEAQARTRASRHA